MRNCIILKTLAAATIAGVLAIGSVAAQDYPTKPVTVIIPFGAGGWTDSTARFLANGLSQAWDQPVVVENRAGGSSQLGTALVAKAAPDGYTLLLTSPSFLTLAAGRADLPYDPIEDFEPVAMVGATSYVLAVGPKVAANSLPDFIAEAKGRDVFYSATGPGSVVHLASELLNHATGLAMEAVHYSSGSESLLDVAAGRTDAYFGPPNELVSFVETGKLRVLAVAGVNRSPLFPDAPTAEELGIVGANSQSGLFVFAPAGTPVDVLAKLDADIQTFMQSPAAVEYFAPMGAWPAQSASATGELVTEEIGRMRTLIAERGLSF